MNEACKNQKQPVDQKQPVALEVLNRLNMLADRANSLRQNITEKLDSVSRQEEPCLAPDPEPLTEYPPLFTEYRDNMNRIESSLSAIEECMRRVEI